MMKKFILTFISAVCGMQVMAQNINPDNDYAQGGTMKSKACCMRDSVATGWCIDGNLTGGFLMQNITTTNLAANYANALNTNIAGVQYKNGVSMGIDLQAGYFFGAGRHFGIGAGIMYMNQQGDLTIDHFHVEYKSIDYYGNTFRQVLTSNGQIKESVNTSNLNIPIVFKYKTAFSHKIGFTADAGLLINVLEQNNYNTKASFDYEAIYKYTGTQGDIVPVYDNSPVPASSDLIITKSQYQSMVSGGNVQQYFNDLRSNNYNVGLGVRPDNRKGSVSYTTPSVGFIVHPALNIWLCSNFSLNLGVYYIYQNFSNNAPSNYQVTDKVGSYSPILKSVTTAVNNNAGIDVGLRYCFGRHKAAPQPVEEAEAPVAPVEETPVASPVNEDDMEPEPVSVSTPILFDLNKATVRPGYEPVIDEAVKEMTENKNKSILEINGYTDNTGAASYNRALSRKRAAAVKSILRQKGVKPRMMKTVGHGSKNPAASNSTAEGRQMNRRVEMKLKPVHEEE